MQKQHTLEDEVSHIVVSMDNKEQNKQEQDEPKTTDQETVPAETIHIHYFPDAIVILKEDTDNPQEDNAVETTLVKPKQPSQFIAYATCVLYLFLIFSTLAFQVYEILNPPIATVTIVPRSQTVTLNSTLQFGRLLHPLTISQSQTTPTTGKGHQDAKQATGYITFYNGQLNSIIVLSGTIFTATNGVQIITDQTAFVPQATPPLEGHATITAHAATIGTLGNIPTKAINEACCAISVLAVNLTPFTGGQDERTFQTVTKRDIDTTALQLKISLAQSTAGALQGQLKPNEQLFLLPCTPHVTADHQIGTEASHVQVTVSQTCNAVAYNNNALQRKATDLLSHRALQKLGTGYSLLGSVQVSVKQSTVTNASRHLVFVSFQAHGTWMYGLSYKAQHQIKRLIAGKPRREAIKFLLSMSGIETASIEGDDISTLPKNPNSIHFSIIIRSS